MKNLMKKGENIIEQVQTNRKTAVKKHFSKLKTKTIFIKR